MQQRANGWTDGFMAGHGIKDCETIQMLVWIRYRWVLLFRFLFFFFRKLKRRFNIMKLPVNFQLNVHSERFCFAITGISTFLSIHSNLIFESQFSQIPSLFGKNSYLTALIKNFGSTYHKFTLFFVCVFLRNKRNLRWWIQKWLMIWRYVKADAIN